jgi:hypothetical protein
MLSENMHRRGVRAYRQQPAYQDVKPRCEAHIPQDQEIDREGNHIIDELIFCEGTFVEENRSESVDKSDEEKENRFSNSCIDVFGLDILY